MESLNLTRVLPTRRQRFANATPTTTTATTPIPSPGGLRDPYLIGSVGEGEISVVYGRSAEPEGKFLIFATMEGLTNCSRLFATV